MELEEMKSLWGDITMEIKKQKKITDSLIMKMIRVNYRNKITRILVPEAIGALGCLAGTLYILTGIHKLNTPWLLACGIISVLILILLPVLSIRAIQRIRSVNIPENNFRQSLSEYSVARIKFVSVQKFSFYLGAILLVVILPVMGALIGGKDLFKENSLWIFYAVLFPSFYAFSRWVFKSYVKTVSDAENILKELEA
jgi:hypothetical protein